MIEQALEHYEQGEYDKALTLYRQMLDDEPDNHQVLYMMALCEQRLGQFASARERLLFCTRLAPAIALYHYALGGLEMRLGRPAEALASYRKAAEVNPNHAAAHMGTGYVLMSQGHYDEAIDALRTALRADPDLNDAYAHLGVALLDSGKPEEAARYLQEAISRNPSDAYAQTHLGRAFLTLGRHAFAAQCLRNALKRYPNQYPLWVWLGQSLLRMGEAREALQAFTQSLELGPETIDALEGIAEANLALGDDDAALVPLLRLVQRQPDEPSHRIKAAGAARRLGRYALALDWLGKVDTQPQAVHLKAAVLLDLQRPEAALSVLADWPTATPDAELEALKIEAHLRRGDVPAVKQALDAFDAAGGHDTLGRLFRARLALVENDLEAALALLAEEPETLPPSYQRSWRRYRYQALVLSGRQVEAQALLDRQTVGNTPLHLVSVITETHPDATEDPATALDRDVIWSWPPAGTEDNDSEKNFAKPFLVYGWPGSGRNALLFALAADPAAAVIHDALRDQNERRAELCWPRGAAALSALSDSALRLARQRYRRAARRQLPSSSYDRPLIDGLWFTARALPTIYRILPGARIIVVERDFDALEVEWRLSGFAKIDRLRYLWQEEQDFLQQARQILPFKWIDLPYQAMLSAPEATLAPLAALLPGLDLKMLGARVPAICDHLLTAGPA